MPAAESTLTTSPGRNGRTLRVNAVAGDMCLPTASHAKPLMRTTAVPTVAARVAADEAGGEMRERSADQGAGGDGGEGIGEEEAAGWADELGYAAETAGVEDGEASGAFGEVEDDGGEGCGWG